MLKVDEYPDQSFNGTLVRTASAIDANSRTLLAEIDVDNPTGQLLPGAYGFVHPGNSRRLRIPSRCRRTRCCSARKGSRSALVRNGRAVLVPVQIGRDYGDKVEIISGLNPTDDLIVNPSDSLLTDTAVSVAAKSRPVRSQPRVTRVPTPCGVKISSSIDMRHAAVQRRPRLRRRLRPPSGRSRASGSCRRRSCRRR